jgi:hypothetical protein
MSHVLEPTKQQQILALGQLGWPVSRIGTAVGVDRATVTRYLRTARLPVRGRGRPSEAMAKPAISPEAGHRVLYREAHMLLEDLADARSTVRGRISSPS